MKPIFVKTSLIKCRGIVLWPFIILKPYSLVKHKYHRLTAEQTQYMDVKLMNHELIHWTQIEDYGVLKFYWEYLDDYIYWRRAGRSHKEAYRLIRFEAEAYAKEADFKYLDSRPRFSDLDY